LEAKEEKPLKSQVNKTIRAVAKWKECAEVLNTSSHVATANEMLGALQNIMESLGAKIARKRRIESGETKGMKIFVVVTTCLLINLKPFVKFLPRPSGT
jgi:TATA-binding protein-associated factor